jgi:NAD(P)-dependent dehydrogenase (short-subunit alcohol dehydrogenase family)
VRLDVSSIGCLVTGASSGIGRAVAAELGRRRCRVALLARRHDELETTARAVEAAGGRAAPFVADVRDDAALRAAVDAGAAWAGGLRLAVVNAGVGVHGALATLPAAALREAVEVNLLGMLGTARAVVPHLRAAPPAALTVTASLSAIIPYRGGGGYAAGKAGLVAALRCLRLELAGSGIAVGWLCAGHADTRILADRIPFTKLPRLARRLVPVLPPERVARELVRLAPRGGERIIPWQAVPFAAFARWFPRLAERALLWSGAGEP